MRIRRAAIILATLAALLTAPSAASAAAPNELLNPGASPGSGTTTTVFTLRVSYRSTGGNAATSVSAQVAANLLAMSLVSGTAVDGTWAVTTTLPAGQWSVVFLATAAKGPQPQILGPTLSVSALLPAPSVGGGSTAPADPASTPASTPPPADIAPASAPSAAPSADAAASAAPGASAVPGASTAPGGSATPTGPGSGGSSGASGGTSGSSSGGGAAPGSGDTPGVTPASSALQAPSGEPTQASVGASPAAAGLPIGGPNDTLVWTVIVVGLAGVGLIAVVGSLWALAGRDGRDGRRPVPVSQPGEADPGVSPARALRRARMRPADDPILAAMGLNEPAAEGSQPSPTRRPIRRIEQVSSGPGERETHRGRRHRAG